MLAPAKVSWRIDLPSFQSGIGAMWRTTLRKSETGQVRPQTSDSDQWCRAAGVEVAGYARVVRLRRPNPTLRGEASDRVVPVGFGVLVGYLVAGMGRPPSASASA